jgi:hypothetical protein
MNLVKAEKGGIAGLDSWEHTPNINVRKDQFAKEVTHVKVLSSNSSFSASPV